MSTICLKDSTHQLLSRFADSEGPARVYAAAILDLLAIQAGEDPVVVMGLRRLEFGADLLEGDGPRAQLLALLLDILADVRGE